MRPIKIAILACAALAMTPAVVVLADDHSATTRVSGKGYDEWAARWFEFMFSFPEAENPANQGGSIDCARNNRGRVWFLAGTTRFGFGELPEVEFHCNVPRRTLFVPLFPIFFSNFPGEAYSSEQKRWFVKSVVDRVCFLQATLNGRPLEFSTPVVRAQSREFHVAAPAGYPSLGLVAGVDDPGSIADGIWAALPPLQAGQHVLNYRVGGLCDANGEPGAGSDVTYHLTVTAGRDDDDDDDDDDG